VLLRGDSSARRRVAAGILADSRRG
jgi:hypothetical protein